jgi:TolA-binding protein
MINEQTSASQSLYEQAKAAQNARSFDTAVTRYSELIKKYPLSQYVGDSLSRIVNMMSQQVQDANQRLVTAYRATNGLVSMNTIATKQTEQSKQLFDEAKNAMTAQDYDTALSKFIDLIKKYPLSSYVQNSLNSINTIVTLRVQAAVRQATAQTNRQSIEQIVEQRNQIGVDINVLSDRQTADSKNLYYQAKTYQSAGNYDTALTLYYELITKFPLSDYVKYSLEKIQEIIKLREQDILAKPRLVIRDNWNSHRFRRPPSISKRSPLA